MILFLQPYVVSNSAKKKPYVVSNAIIKLSIISF